MAIHRDKVFEAAQKYIEKRKYDKAVAELRRIVAADPSDARTLHKIGDLQMKMGQLAEAVDTYDTVGKLYANGGFALKAIAVYKQIREIIATQAPHVAERYGHIAPRLADLYQECGLPSESLAVLEEVGANLQHQQRDLEAADVFRRMAGLDPTNPLAHLRVAEALSRARDYEAAVAEFASAASLLIESERPNDAIHVLERLLQHKADPEHAKTCARLYLARNRPNDAAHALAKLQICYQANPRDIEALVLVARGFETVGQTAKAVDVYKEAARIAREVGRRDVFAPIVTHLTRIAPHDGVVRDLARMLH